MSDKGLIVRGSPELREARALVPWVKDDDLDELEDREAYAAAAMSLALPGSGHIYTHDYAKGFAIAIGAIAFAAIVPAGILGYVAGGVISSILAYKKSKKINRFVKARWRDGHHPENKVKTTRLLSAMKKRPKTSQPVENAPAAGPPAPVHPLVDSLRKLATLHRNGMITDLELDERKIDLLTESATALPRDQLDDLLFTLLPLRNEGTLSDSDIEFIKTLSP